jgi:FR47-like protein
VLTPVADVAAALAAFGDPKPSEFTFRKFCKRAEVLLFAERDNGALVALKGAGCMVMADSPVACAQAMRDLYGGHLTSDAGWPNETTRRDWEREGGEYLFLDSSPIAVCETGLEVGFLPPPDSEKHHHANLYWFEGKPRLSGQIKHSCRLGRGLELWQQLKSGVGYDEDGYYTRQVLLEKPSFVCEVGGQAVSWSTIHLSGSMGMIFTPPEHRRHGYARSLACFQIDHVLREHGFACCHVNSENVASYTMLLDLGATRDEITIGWRTLLWPDGKCPYSV